MATLKYRAFLSYSHRDAAWAKWLHRALETYRIDKDLVGRETIHGLVPKTLRPIFRDREDFSAGHSLTEQTRAALQASQFLIVLCSPNAAQSGYVNEEIRCFKALGRAAHVINVIVDGEPGDPERECFPPAVRFKVGADGEITEEREHPIAADARPQGDGKEIAKEKVVAGLLGVGLDEIMRRAERARKRRNLVRIGAVSVGVLLTLGAVLGWTGAVFLDGRLRSSELVNIETDAADICERTSSLAVADVWRIALALECLETLTQGLTGLPKDAHLPRMLVSAVETNLTTLRKFRTEGKLTSEQSDLLDKVEILAAQLAQR
jgi:TIR domain-containing protein